MLVPTRGIGEMFIATPNHKQSKFQNFHNRKMTKSWYIQAMVQAKKQKKKELPPPTTQMDLTGITFRQRSHTPSRTHRTIPLNRKCVSGDADSLRGVSAERGRKGALWDITNVLYLLPW